VQGSHTVAEVVKSPQLRTKRLFLRELRPADAATLLQYRSAPEVARYQSWHPKSEREVEAFIRRTHRTGFDVTGSWFQLGIYLEPNLELIGDIGVHFLPPDNRQTEIGFSLSPHRQQKGYATEAVRALLDHLFRNLKKHRVTASVDPRNIASIKLLEKIGMRLEGHFRQSIWMDEGWADDLIYALLDTEWNAE
jgi:RimJ/RimL family protein N-acetyltransferase